MNIHVFDFEVFPHDWLLVYTNMDGSKHHIHNDREALRKVYEQDKNALWVGYNCRFYDQYIFKAILLGFDPFKVSQWIIGEDKPGWAYSDNFGKIPLVFFDLMFDRNKSLKQLEGFMGIDIEECDIPWNLDRPLTKDEFNSVLHYCEHDVDATCEVFTHNMPNFKAYLRLIDEYNLPFKFFCKTKAQLGSKILGAVYREHDDEWEVPITDTVDLGRFAHLKDWFTSDENHTLDAQLVFTVDGVEVVIAWGGAHGAPNEPVVIVGNLLNIDVASQYPSIIIEHGYMSRNVGRRGLKLYSSIKKERVGWKKTDKDLADATKIVLNSVYGSLGDKNNALYDPRNLHAVCANGQLMIMDLADKLIDIAKIINLNTDGILVQITDPSRTDEIIQICHDWEKRNKMELEFDYYDKIIQRDVNNYVMIDTKGHVKRKGSWVKKCSPLDNDLPILRNGLVECLINGKTPREVVEAEDELINFQRVVKVGGMYKHCEHNGKIYHNKVYRIFASKDESDGPLLKCKEGMNPAKIGDSPEHCFIHNGDIRGMKCPVNLDKEWYIMMLERRLKLFTGGIE